MTDACLKDVVPTSQLRTVEGMEQWSPVTCQLYSKLPGFPEPLQIAGVNFYRRDEVHVWALARIARIAKDRAKTRRK